MIQWFLFGIIYDYVYGMPYPMVYDVMVFGINKRFGMIDLHGGAMVHTICYKV